MKGLSIHQPFASLIADGEKFVENRTWEAFYRGPLAICASKGSRYISTDELAKYPTGCIVAVSRLAKCLHIDSLRDSLESGVPILGMTLDSVEAILNHEHTEGPFCWVLLETQQLPRPIPMRGSQGLFTIPNEKVVEIYSQLPHLAK